MTDKLMYSTGKNTPTEKVTAKMRLETKGRGGKSVTVVFNLSLPPPEAESLLREFKSQFGCGGTMKEKKLELQGDRRAAIEKYFGTRGWTIVRAGG